MTKSCSNTAQFPYINNTNDIYVYFELTRMYKARSILDIGMFLARSGALSRQVKDAAISPDIFLCGIPLYLDILPVHTKMYDCTASLEELLSDNDVFFDIVYALDIDQNFWNENKDKLIPFLVSHTSRIILNDTSEGLSEYLKKYGPLTPITVGDDVYTMIG